MRVTQRRLVEQATQLLAEQLERRQRSQSVVATGKRILKPEDDPAGVERALALHSRVRFLQTTQSNLTLSRDWMSATETALQGLQEVLQGIYQTALKAANEASQSDTAFEAWLAEVDEGLAHAVEIGNSSHRGLYLFSGHRVNTPPFELVSTPTLQVNYNGDSGAIEHQLEEGTRIQVNVAGDDPMFGQIFDSLIHLRAQLQAQDTAGIEAAIGDLDQAMDAVAAKLAVIGSRVQRVDRTSTRLQALELDLRGILNQTEDADMAEAMLNLRLDEQSYEATLAATSRLFGPSLIDYLG
jgi:flagellar hook-associated protein 3 FlgL